MYITSNTLAKALLDNWVYPYGSHRYLLAGGPSNLDSKFFEAVCNLLGIRHYFTTAYHPRTNGQVQGCKKPIVARLPNYIEEHQDRWDEYFQPLPYAYDLPVHRLTGTTAFGLLPSRPPPSILLKGESVPNIHLGDDLNRTTVQVKNSVLERRRKTLGATQVKLTASQRRYQAVFDCEVRMVETVVAGDDVLADIARNTKRCILEGTDMDKSFERSRKLMAKANGP